MNRSLFSSASVHWATPANVYDALHAEFNFDLDPCPLSNAPAQDGLAIAWHGRRVYCNPPYGRGIGDWLAKGLEADVAVFLLPARTDTKWWHEHAVKADEIRFLKGRIKFGGSKNSAPFPSVVLIYKRQPTAVEDERALYEKWLRDSYLIETNWTGNENAVSWPWRAWQARAALGKG